jgi:lactoylglutathione lyase
LPLSPAIAGSAIARTAAVDTATVARNRLIMELLSVVCPASPTRFETDKPIEKDGGCDRFAGAPGGLGSFPVAEYLHTMLRITDPEKSRQFYEALGFTFSRDMDIVRNGEREATNYFYSMGDQENVLELTFNHDGRSYELGDAYGHIAVGVDDLAQTLDQLKTQGIEAEREPYRVREGGSLICFVRDPDQYRVELIDRSGK